MNERLLIKVTKDSLPQIKERYPFIYLERGRLEIDDSSVKWIDSERNVVRIPCATISTILLGPGTSVTHEAVKVLSSSNCSLCWVGEDGFLFYAVGESPTADSRKLRRQAELSSDPEKSLAVAKRMFAKRFPSSELAGKSLKDLMGMEGSRVRDLYDACAAKYKVGWSGRSYQPGKFELSDTTNKLLTASNAALYALLSSVVCSLGYSPRLGFIHSGSPLPFVYDLADLYKDSLCIDLAFNLTYQLAGRYDRAAAISEFRKRLLESKLLEHVAKDVSELLEEKRKC